MEGGACPHCLRPFLVKDGKLEISSQSPLPRFQLRSLPIGESFIIQGTVRAVTGAILYSDGSVERILDLGRDDFCSIEDDDSGKFRLYRRIKASDLRMVGDEVEYLTARFSAPEKSQITIESLLGVFAELPQVGKSFGFVEYQGQTRHLACTIEDGQKEWYLVTIVDRSEILPSEGAEKRSSDGSAAAGPQQPFQLALPLLGPTLVLMAAALVLQTIFVIASRNESVFSSAKQGSQGESRWVSEPINLSGSGNVMATVSTNLANSWGYFELALVNTANGKRYLVSDTVQYWLGGGGDSFWSEGSPYANLFFSRIPAGEYVLDVSAYSETPPLEYWVQLTRDVARWHYFLIALGVIAAWPAIVWAREWARGETLETIVRAVFQLLLAAGFLLLVMWLDA